MSDSPQDDARLRATEAQMRHALGLDGDTPLRPKPGQPTTPANGSHPQRRRFARDGEVPVTVVHRGQHPGAGLDSNQLDAARQAIRSQVAAKESAERLLQYTQATIRDLQTKLAHERLARDEALDVVNRANTDRQTVQQTLQTVQAELVTERVARWKAEERLSTALEARQDAERRIRDMKVAPHVQKPSKTTLTARAGRTAGDAEETPVANPDMEEVANKALVAVPKALRKSAKAPRPEQPDALQPVQHRRRGRPPKVEQREEDVVEWWVPGWKTRLR